MSLHLEAGKSKKAKRIIPHVDSPLELTGGDQLKKEDIENALANVDLNSLYSSSTIDLGKSAKVTQLYFGPGFEDRLELEMDE